jgi:cytochrome c
MSRCRRSVLGALSVALLAGGAAQAQGRFPGVGRPATPAEIRAWDIDVRPDFTGLPRGSGSVAKGQEVWDEKCAACHGTFGESTQVFPPIVGGTTKADMETGRAAGLRNPTEQRTTLMKLATLSTLWDYVNRAMPWNAPKTLTTEEVYALVAYILHLGDVVPADFVLSDGNIREVQDRLPNRHGLTRRHGLWDVKGTPDVKSPACMRDCPADGTVTSTIPGHARNSHGNLLEQNRLVGPVRGADTTKPPVAGAPGEAARALAKGPQVAASGPAGTDGLALARKHACVACHAVDQRTVGPSFVEIAGKYRQTTDAAAALVSRMKSGGAGAWGSVPMPPQAHVDEGDLRAIAQWILAVRK